MGWDHLTVITVGEWGFCRRCFLSVSLWCFCPICQNDEQGRPWTVTELVRRLPASVQTDLLHFFFSQSFGQLGLDLVDSSNSLSLS